MSILHSKQYYLVRNEELQRSSRLNHHLYLSGSVPSHTSDKGSSIRKNKYIKTKFWISRKLRNISLTKQCLQDTHSRFNKDTLYNSVFDRLPIYSMHALTVGVGLVTCLLNWLHHLCLQNFHQGVAKQASARKKKSLEISPKSCSSLKCCCKAGWNQSRL